MKLINWSRVPRGTMTNEGEVVDVEDPPLVSILHDSRTGWRVTDYYTHRLRIVPQTRWTYHDGGECPVPEGLTFEVLYPWEGYRHIKTNADKNWEWSEVFAYRITGVDRAGGWTDDPSEVAPPVEIISQTSHTVGNVGVSFTVGRVKP